MNKIVFTVNARETNSFFPVIQEIRKFPCKIHLELSNGIIQVEDASDDVIKELLNCINKYFTILSIDIDNTNETEASQPDYTTASETSESKINQVSKIAKVSPSIRVKKNLTSYNAGKYDAILLELFSSAFTELAQPNPIKYKVNHFLNGIGMYTASIEIRDAFIVATDVDKITYANVINAVHRLSPKNSRDELESLFQRTFKNWLEKYPQLKELKSNFSFIHLLRAFSRYSRGYYIIS